MSDERDIKECCMEDISFIHTGVEWCAHLRCSVCDTRWNIRRDDE